MFKFHLYVLLLFIYFTSGLASLHAEEQSNPDSVAGTTLTEKKKKDSESSEVERILKLEVTLKKGKKNLREMKKGLTARSKISNKLRDALKRVSSRLEERKTKLARAKQKGEADKTARLESEINKLEQDYAQIKEQSQLTFEAEKIFKKKIDLLEKSLLQEQQILDELKGISKPAPSAPPQPSPETVLKSEPTSQTLPVLPGQQLITPGSPKTETIDRTPAQSKEKLQTAEQIEARKQAEKRTQEAFRAEQIALDYIERKSAFLEQIKLDELLLKTDIESLKNYKEFLLPMEQKLKNSKSQQEHNKIKQNMVIVKAEISKLDKKINKRRAHLATAQKQLKQLEDDQQVLAKEAQQKREQAEAAQQHVVWLQSPLHPRNLLSWAYTRGPRVLLVFIIMFMLLYLNKITASKISRVMARKSVRKGEMSQNRVNTLALSFRGAARVVIIFGGMLFAFQEAGVDIKTILGGAAILGVAIAFGAQNLMRDYFNGFMILLEDQYELNDIVTINNTTGTVERVSMRTTMLRDLNGRAHFIPNGSINRVSNSTYEWSRAVFDVPVAYRENVDHVMTVILELAKELRQDAEFGPYILEEPVMLGVNSFDDFGVTIKFMLQTRADKMWSVRREMLRRIKNKFDELGIKIPVPQRVIPQPVVQK